MGAVHVTDPAKEDFLKLDGSAQESVVRALKKLKTSPEMRGEPLGKRALSNLTGLRKLPAGRNKSIRIVYTVNRDGSACVVYVIAGRADEECYKLAAERIAALDGGVLKGQYSRLIDAAWSL